MKRRVCFSRARLAHLRALVSAVRLLTNGLIAPSSCNVFAIQGELDVEYLSLVTPIQAQDGIRQATRPLDRPYQALVLAVAGRGDGYERGRGGCIGAILVFYAAALH